MCLASHVRRWVPREVVARAVAASANGDHIVNYQGKGLTTPPAPAAVNSGAVFAVAAPHQMTPAQALHTCCSLVRG
jgi:hypothetical protein